MRIYDCIEKAHEMDNLTPFGQEMYKRLAGMKQNLYYHEGDLTQIGYRQLREMGKRMVNNYPEVFPYNAFLKVNGTNVLRVSSSMQSFIAKSSKLILK